MDFLPVKCDEDSYADYVALFARCFPAANKFSRDYLDWLYHRNPDGLVVGFDARDGGNLAAHYVCIPLRAHICGQEVKALLSLNTATHPDHQGKGLFIQLAERTYEAGAALGYDCIYGVANANSTPGFIRKLKFQHVGQLQAKVGIGALGIDFDRFGGLHFRRSWNPDALAWRCASPVRPVTVRTRRNRKIFLTPALMGRFCLAVAEVDDAPVAADAVGMTGSFASPLRLFIGMVPPVAQRHSLYMDIPQALRPSPLNFIYRSISGRVPSIDADKVFFNFLDFDAY